MKRWIAVLLLVVFAAFLAASGADYFDHGVEGQDQHAQHLFCVDDCAPAMISQTPPPPPDPMPRPVFETSVVRPILNLDLEPEKEPPRNQATCRA